MEFLQEFGYIGLFIGSFLAATVVPFSSEFLVTGLLIAGGEPLAVFLWATIGNWLGSVTSYYIGYLGKWEWIERWFRVKEETLIKQKERVDKYGVYLALLCWLPFIGDVFAIGLGFYKLDYKKCILFMLIGKAIRFGVWIYLYLFFGETFFS